MGIFDYFGGFLIGAVIDPTSSYEEMQNKIESNEEEAIDDDNFDVESTELGQDSNDLLTNLINDVNESVEPEDDFNSLVMDIKKDFEDDSEADDA